MAHHIKQFHIARVRLLRWHWKLFLKLIVEHLSRARCLCSVRNEWHLHGACTRALTSPRSRNLSDGAAADDDEMQMEKFAADL